MAILAPERAMEEKRKFYERVIGMKMEDRFKITADIKQELKIMKN